MLFKSSIHLLICSSVLFFINKPISSSENFSKRSKRNAPNYQPRCTKQNNPIDQVINFNYTAFGPPRKKRFVLFPEFINFLDKWEFLNSPQTFIYWIANFYPDRVYSDYVHYYISDMIQQISVALGTDVILQNASDPGEANFHYNFFDYTICPLDDTVNATVDNVQVLDSLSIYPVKLTRESRYRAHGGIHHIEDKKPISTIKLNMQQTFLHSDDLVYDPIIYTCVDATNVCLIDLYWALLHETLHGFGIEHTANPEKPEPPNQHMQSVMYFSNLRILCHDDIRAIRMVYQLPVTRENAIHDDTCRRDFPMNKLQKIMYLIGKWLVYLSIGFLILSTIMFILTLIYLLLRYFCQQKSNHIEKQSSSMTFKKPVLKTNRSGQPHGYLWHDEML